MKLFLAFLLLGMAGQAAALAQQDADNRYLMIYEEVREADGLLRDGSRPAALAAYTAAQGQLEAFKNLYPDWNPGIVDYRLEDMAGKIADLQPQSAAAPADARPGPAAPPPAASGAAPPWQDQLLALRQENARLQAKLQEALSQQPASAEADALNRANEKILALTKENTLLRLERRPADETNVLALTARLKDSEQRRAEEAALIARLTSRNQALQTTLDQTVKTDAELRRRLEARLAATATAARRAASQPGSPADWKRRLAAASLQQTVLMDQIQTMANNLVATDERYEAALFDLTTQRDHLSEDLKAASPGGQVIDLNTTLPADALHPAPSVSANRSNHPADPGTDPAMAPAVNAARGGVNPRPASLAKATGRGALAKLAGVELAEGRLEAAQTDITASLAQSPPDAPRLELRARIESARKDNAAALADLEQACRLETGNPALQTELGSALLRLGRPADAETAWLQAVRLDPHQAGAHYYLARLYLAGHPPLPQLARWHYEQALLNGQSRDTALEQQLTGWGGTAAP